MKPRFSEVLEMAVEEGAMHGIAKAFKENETPTREEIRECVVLCVLGNLDRWFDMGEYDE